MQPRDEASSVGEVGTPGRQHDDVRNPAVGDRTGDRGSDRVGVRVKIVDREIEGQEHEETVASGDRLTQGGSITENGRPNVGRCSDSVRRSERRHAEVLVDPSSTTPLSELELAWRLAQHPATNPPA